MANETVKIQNKNTLTNIFLAASFTYILFLFSEENSTQRKTFYLLIFILNIIAIVFVNKEEKLFLQISEFFSNLWYKITNKKKPIKEERDEIRELVEKTVQKEFQSQQKVKEGLINQEWKSLNEKEILCSANKSNLRINLDEWGVYTGVRSFHDLSALKTPGVQYKFHQEPSSFKTNLINRQQGENYSHEFLKSMLMMGYQTKLREGNEFSAHYDYFNAGDMELKWQKNFKSFIGNKLTEQILHEHRENLNLINSILTPSLNIKLEGELVSDRVSQKFRQILGEALRDPDLRFSSKMNEESNRQQNFKIEKDNKIQAACFFGDDETLKDLIELISLSFAKLNRGKEYKHHSDKYDNIYSKSIYGLKDESLGKTLFSSVNETKGANQNKPEHGFSLSYKLKNPLVNEQTKEQFSYDFLLKQHSHSIHENLSNLKTYIQNRIKINSLLAPYFIKERSQKHKFLIL